jgi:hypothetical protein
MTAFIDQRKKYLFPTVTPIRLPDVLNLATSYSATIDNWGTTDHLNDMKTIEESFRKWFSPLINLDKFKYCYFLNNGSTQGIEFLSLLYKDQKIYLEQGDYFWLKTIGNGEEVANPIACDYSYKTSPSAINGSNITNQWNSKAEILDCAYIGTSLEKIIPGNNTEHILLSFSKNIGLPELRAGMIFSKKPIKTLEIFQKQYGYVGLVNFKIIKKIIENFTIIDLATTLKQIQNDFCNDLTEYKIAPTDSALLGTSTHDYFDWYKRPNGFTRIPLGESINDFLKLHQYKLF